MREKKVHVIDRLSSNSLILVGKVTGDKVVFIRVLVFVFCPLKGTHFFEFLQKIRSFPSKAD